MKFRVATLIAAVVLSAQAPAYAAKWESVATSGGDRVELDRSRVARPGAGAATAWSRLVRDGIYIDDYGMRYTTVEAFNRYDCTKGSFTTLKRVWRRDGQLVREEPIAAPQELSADAGSPDARMLTEVCGNVAELVAREGKPGVMHADMRMAGDAAKPKTLPVADAKGAKKPAEEKPAEAAASMPAGKPRYIELPAIDKSKLEDPHKPMAGKDGKAAEPTKPAKTADMQDIAKAAAAAAAESAAAGVSRQSLERQFATSGPRPVARKKVAAKKPAEPVIASPPPVARKHVHWSYEGEGEPANWGKLEGKYATCDSGRRQSPIDIRDGIKVDLEAITFNYNWTQFRIIDNGHTVMVSVGENNSITVMGRTFQLVQFHFHRPAEEKIRGKSYDMVAHMVHKDDDGRLAVVAVLMSKGGTEHQLIQALWNNMPLETNQEVAPATTIDLSRILPEKHDYYTYMGSLTTPPCTEDVLWMVFKQPINVSDQQVAIFSRLYKNNARPVQPTNDRLVKESR